MNIDDFINTSQSIAVVSFMIFILLNSVYSKVDFDNLPKIVKFWLALWVYTFIVSSTVAFVGWLWT